MGYVVEAHNLTRLFGTHLAVDQLDLTIERGEVFGFLGPNGAGKTTTVRLLNGILNASGGSARVAGFDPATHGPDVRRRTGVLTETPALYEQLTARVNLSIFGALYGMPKEEIPDRVKVVLDLFDLSDRADEKVGGFSKGMKQRVALARALIHAPEVLFLDEPTAGLDPSVARQVTELIEQLSQEEGRTIFLCTHNLTEAQRLCHRVGVINKGRLLAVGTPAELADHLWHGLWVHVDLGMPLAPANLDALSRLPGVLDLESHEKALEVRLESPEHTPALVQGLVSAGAAVYRVAPREHSLEEVYFQLQDQEGAANGAPAEAAGGKRG